MDITTAKNLTDFLLNRKWKVNGNTYNLKELGWTFAGFDRATRRLGICYGGYKKQIGLSKKMTELRTREEVEQTLRHEIGHAIDNEIRGHSAHDNTWKNIARQCGYNGERTTKVSNEVKVAAYAWFAFCENDGILGGWTRKPKNNKVCRKCRTSVLILPATDERIINAQKN